MCLSATSLSTHLVATSTSFKVTVNPHDHKTQYMFYFAVKVSLKTFFAQKSLSELVSGCEQNGVQLGSGCEQNRVQLVSGCEQNRVQMGSGGE